MVIATARVGSKFGEVADAIEENGRSQKVFCCFWPPSRGLHEIAKAEGARLEKLG